MSYSEVTISGYNSSPPPDDGSTGPTNQVKWATIKSKLFDPLRTALELIDDRVASAITTADASLATLQSSVSSANSNVTALATALTAPSGTVMLFAQTSAPTGWAKGSTYDDYALRLVTGTPGVAGSTAFTSVFTARTVATENLPSHTHTFSDAGRTVNFTGTTTAKVYNIDEDDHDDYGSGNYRGLLTSAGNNNNNLTATYTMACTSDNGTGSGGTWDFAVQYVDVILATKS